MRRQLMSFVTEFDIRTSNTQVDARSMYLKYQILYLKKKSVHKAKNENGF